jgi:hypothetical protein
VPTAPVAPTTASDGSPFIRSPRSTRRRIHKVLS